MELGDISVDDFYANDVHTNFIDKMCAFLGVSTDRMKIVGIVNRSRRFLAGGKGVTVDVSLEDDREISSVVLDGEVGTVEGQLQALIKNLQEEIVKDSSAFGPAIQSIMIEYLIARTLPG